MTKCRVNVPSFINNVLHPADAVVDYDFGAEGYDEKRNSNLEPLEPVEGFGKPMESTLETSGDATTTHPGGEGNVGDAAHIEGSEDASALL